jgi:hypothetical protein
MMTPPFDGDCRRGRDAAEYLSKRITLPTSIAVTATTPMRLRIVNCARANRIDTTSCSTAMSDLQSIRSTFTYRFTPDCVRQLSFGYYTSGGRGGGGDQGRGTATVSTQPENISDEVRNGSHPCGLSNPPTNCAGMHRSFR